MQLCSHCLENSVVGIFLSQEGDVIRAEHKLGNFVLFVESVDSLRFSSTGQFVCLVKSQSVRRQEFVTQN